jgi:hypothetical protein
MAQTCRQIWINNGCPWDFSHIPGSKRLKHLQNKKVEWKFFFIHPTLVAHGILDISHGVKIYRKRNC